ncbi:MAG: 30S ribosomal protein S16 [Anaerolineae bacterium]|jgi:small subunit ribosomal protein S16
MVKIRLRRVGAKKQASFRVVVADSRSPRDGRFIEEIGFYNPRTEPETLRIDEERALHWLTVGAQPTDSAARLLETTGTMERFQRLKQGEPLGDLIAEAEEVLAGEAEEEALALEAAQAPEAEVEEKEAEEEAPEAELQEAPEATADVTESESEESGAEAEADEAVVDVEVGQAEAEMKEAEEEDEPER